MAGKQKLQIFCSLYKRLKQKAIFFTNYPNEVKGLLLLDPAPESYWNSMSKRELKKYIK